MSKFTRTVTPFKLALLCGAVMPFMLAAPATQAETLGKDDVKAIIAEYLQENPKVVIDALEAYRVQEEKRQEAEASSKLKQFKPYFTAADRPSAGASADKAKITIVEFFDYNCGYCKRALPDVVSAISENDDVRVVFQEMPILSPLSQNAAKWAEAAHFQGKYFEFHKGLMEFQGNKTEDALSDIAKKAGLDVAKLKKDAESKEVQENIEKSMAAAREIGIQGTPAFIVGDTLYRGYIGEDGMRQAIEEARKTVQ
ncbi:MAG: DsbA family protein [Alphaproteobacteria bacterium]|nr:DsbA family protein [Alphaproteobacteria bacterium]